MTLTAELEVAGPNPAMGKCLYDEYEFLDSSYKYYIYWYKNVWYLLSSIVYTHGISV